MLTKHACVSMGYANIYRPQHNYHCYMNYHQFKNSHLFMNHHYSSALIVVTIPTISTLITFYMIPFPSPFITFFVNQQNPNNTTNSLIILVL
jgi:hypothetical protein